MLESIGVVGASILTDIASYFTVPSMGGLYSVPSIANPALAVIASLFNVGMPIFPDKYEENGGNEIGEQVLVGGLDFSGVSLNSSVGALTRVMDNVVVQPRTWKIHGYMGINLEHSRSMRFVVGGMFTWPIINSFVQKFGRSMLNQAIKKYIRYITQARYPFKFTTADGDTIPALVKSYSFKDESENLNWVDVDLELREFCAIGLKPDGTQEVIGGMDSEFNLFPSPANMARGALKAVGLGVAKVTA